VVRVGGGTITITDEYVDFAPLTADPSLVEGRVWFRKDLDRFRYSPDGKTVKPVPVEHAELEAIGPDDHHARDHASRHVAGGADAITSPLDLAAIPSPLTNKEIDRILGVTVDPALVTGKVWLRTDLGRLRYSPDGTAVKVVPVEHAELEAIGPDDHHAKLHAATHADGGVDEITTPLDLAAIPTPLTGQDADLWAGKHRTDDQSTGGDVEIGVKMSENGILNIGRINRATTSPRVIVNYTGSGVFKWVHGVGVSSVGVARVYIDGVLWKELYGYVSITNDTWGVFFAANKKFTSSLRVTLEGDDGIEYGGSAGYVT